MSDTDVLEGEPSSEKGSAHRRRVKVEGAPSSAWVELLYAEQPTLAWNRVDPITRHLFEVHYGLCNRGLAPKRLKYGVHITEQEVEDMFGPKVSANGYRYSWSEDEEFVKKVERLWMITHQRTSVPNTRLINVAEAKGLVYEIVKGKEVNWCIHGEWTCREQLRRINAEADAKKEKAPVVDLVDQDDLERGGPPRSDCLQQTARSVVLESKTELTSMAIGEWQEYLSLLEKEAPTLDGLVKRLGEDKDATNMVLVKVSSQVEYGRTLSAAAQSRLTALQGEYEECKVKLEALKSADPQSAVHIEAAVVDLDNVQKKVDSQVGVIDQFQGLFAAGEVDYFRSVEKSRISEEAWTKVVQKQELWKRHRVALSSQLKSMKTNYQRPALYPAPLPFLYLEAEIQDVPIVGIEIGACPYCTRGFEPAWDCKFSSCKHPYHTWCSLSHFSKVPTCMSPDCGQEQHEDWWAMAGLKKPEVDHNGMQMELWEITKSEDVPTEFQGELGASH